jgi:hypothetical protein
VVGRGVAMLPSKIMASAARMPGSAATRRHPRHRKQRSPCLRLQTQRSCPKRSCQQELDTEASMLQTAQKKNRLR